MRILVTAGPTREPIDPVRFVSNRSSGKMGYAAAVAARERGHDVVLVSGPVSLPAPAGVELVSVVTAEDMLAAVKGRIGWCDALVMAAAVADWRPSEVSAAKLKKGRGGLNLRMEKTPDILESVATMKGDRTYVGFAAETGDPVEEAGRKLKEKGLDLVVGNDVSRPDGGFDTETNTVVLVAGDGSVQRLPLMPKTEAAERIIAWIEKNRRGARP